MGEASMINFDVVQEVDAQTMGCPKGFSKNCFHLDDSTPYNLTPINLRATYLKKTHHHPPYF